MFWYQQEQKYLFIVQWNERERELSLCSQQNISIDIQNKGNKYVSNRIIWMNWNETELGVSQFYDYDGYFRNLSKLLSEPTKSAYN